MTSASPYSYELPEDRIAQRPVHPPESAKMMVISRGTGLIEHRTFADIGMFLQPGDLLVFNDTKVIPARLFGKLDGPDGPDVEVVVIEEVAKHEWSALGFPMRKIRGAERVFFSERLSALVLPSASDDRLMLRFVGAASDDLGALLLEHGTMPIPPYIRDGRADDQDRIDYQSIFAVHPGSVAAPTASLHFTETLIDELKSRHQCSIERITLHVGTASFQPIVVNGVLRKPGHERFVVSESVLESIARTKASGRRVIAVGTTVVRALETAARREVVNSGGDSTDLFIEPGFEFRIVDSLVTNFHQPRTTHLLLVEALLGAELLNRAYVSALANKYRFLSYGDGMFIV
jgi:S-adenosylmethionine:tRNA ribosyltransferase-isomerase